MWRGKLKWSFRMSFKIRKKFRNKITDFIIYILRIIVPIIAVIINGAMLIEFIKNQNTQDLSVFLIYTEKYLKVDRRNSTQY